MPSRSDSVPVSAWPLAGALIAIVVVGLLPAEAWHAIAAIGCLTLLAHAWIGTPSSFLIRRMAALVPFLVVCGVALGGQGAGGEVGVWVHAFLWRCAVTFLIGLWLAETMTAGQLIEVLRRWRCPAVLVMILGLQLRYIAVLWDEHERLRRAQWSRVGRIESRWLRWRQAIERLGLLLLRSLDRAERVQRAMESRGWDGDPRGWS